MLTDLMALLNEALSKELTKGTKADNANAQSSLLLMPCICFGLVVKGHGSIQRKNPAACDNNVYHLCMHHLGKQLTTGKCSGENSPDVHCLLTGDGIRFGTNVRRLVNCCGSWARSCREACLLLPD